jgi:hypothetical protein
VKKITGNFLSTYQKPGPFIYKRVPLAKGIMCKRIERNKVVKFYNITSLRRKKKKT